MKKKYSIGDEVQGLIKFGLNKSRHIISSGKRPYAINISVESVIRRGYFKRKTFLRRRWLVEETLVYEMACDFPRSDSNLFGNGEYYAEEETTGAYWVFRSKETANKFIQKEFN